MAHYYKLHIDLNCHPYQEGSLRGADFYLHSEAPINLFPPLFARDPPNDFPRTRLEEISQEEYDKRLRTPLHEPNIDLARALFG